MFESTRRMNTYSIPLLYYTFFFTAYSASIRSIASLFGVWLVVFAVYGIMFTEIFGLTSYGPNGSDHVNFRNVGSSLLMMARMSTG